MGRGRIALAALIALSGLGLGLAPQALSEPHETRWTWTLRPTPQPSVLAGRAEGRPFGRCRVRLVVGEARPGGGSGEEILPYRGSARCGGRGRVRVKGRFFLVVGERRFSGNGRFTRGTGEFQGLQGRYENRGRDGDTEARVRFIGTARY